MPDLPAGRYVLRVAPDFAEFTRDVELSGDRKLALSY